MSTETPTAAASWERRKARYLRAGICHGCAAQAAYGHAHGFAQVHPPCGSCRPVVATLPVPAANGWRKTAGRKPPADLRARGTGRCAVPPHAPRPVIPVQRRGTTQSAAPR